MEGKGKLMENHLKEAGRGALCQAGGKKPVDLIPIDQILGRKFRIYLRSAGGGSCSRSGAGQWRDTQAAAKCSGLVLAAAAMWAVQRSIGVVA